MSGRYKYAVLMHPGHNRVYFEESKGLAISELTLALGDRCRGASIVELCSVPYLTFEADGEDTEIPRTLSKLSFTYAAYILGDDGALRPVDARREAAFSIDIGGMLKYSGKTNETFTRLMINAALYSSDFAGQEHVSLLDPLMGKGTTLFEAAMSGYDAYGIEIMEGVVNEAQVFFKKFLESEKYKHIYNKERYGGDGMPLMNAHVFEYARDKDALKAAPQRLVMAAGDARYSDKCFGKSKFHIIAADLPYGIFHGSAAGGGKSRNPAGLLTACLPAWRNSLKRGGALALSWNQFVLPRAALNELLERAGLTVMSGGVYESFGHRVDQAIKRDLIIARKD